MSESDTNTSESGSAADDAKAKFREALDRKRGKQADRQSHADAESKVHGEHAAAATQRNFRRKSGG
ncbi:hypothetical protein SAMN05892883_0401 [Jatrophihabitans sp. GAS493]|uniref:DUF5302 domain-containing protein n=1 Tax=Jatrophihabitans sp. GAS493 TaxID=1907575 RepID=UPI000BB90C18|nr:DUF5302 domain-containing protein [Jatrophihabitans sp. GAS493]SOD70755.1 hypothetical protein SAMN05892883_0401 [Jatrophihabitans sp. GAS493]